MDQQEQSLIDRIKQAQNVLVTVSVNPSVDQLAAAIGLTVALNKLDKHGTAVFSGEVPSTIEFLKPEETLEKNTDSLRDFIIALDKSKADKLRYKVEDQVVRIFITPYKTSISENDLDFSQGDFNVDVVVALGVADQKDIDAAITAHGRILHDATVTSISTQEGNNLGTINWVDKSASSLSEMMLGLIDGLDKKILDNQIATALLTGIVASTDRFRNEKTSPKAMSASAELMAAGANQQLIATELETPPPPPPEPEPQPEPEKPKEAKPPEPPVEPPHTEPGELDITHDDEPAKPAADEPPELPEEEPPMPPEEEKDELLLPAPTPVPGGGTIISPDADHQPKPDEPKTPEPPVYEPASVPEPEPEPEPVPEPDQPQIHVDDDGTLRKLEEDMLAPMPAPLAQNGPMPQISQVHGVNTSGKIGDQSAPPDVVPSHRERVTEPPSLSGTGMTANTDPEEEFEPTTEQLAEQTHENGMLLKHNESVLPATDDPAGSPKDNPFLPQKQMQPMKPAPKDWRSPEPPAAPEPPPLPPMPKPLPPVDPFVPPPPPPPVPQTPPPLPPLPPALTPPPKPQEPPESPFPPAPDPFKNPFEPPAPKPLTGPDDTFAQPPVPAPSPSMLPPAPSLPPPDPSAPLVPLPPPPVFDSPAPAGPQGSDASGESTVNDARNAVEAALKGSAAPSGPSQPIAALNAQPLGPELHAAVPLPNPGNPGFSEPTPGNTPADETLDMPLPSNPFGPGQQPAPPIVPLPPSSFPGTPPAGSPQGNGQLPPPPVPPPMLPPV